ncbi:MAG: hypothetical protein JJE36_03765 [Coriobacteriia bacterium]|nr:hypothetical protein [Coriobacteriia bacterium]
MKRLEESSGQAVLEYLIGSFLVAIILLALAGVWHGWREEAVRQDSMLGKTFTSAPYSNSSSMGGSAQGAKDILMH